MFDGLHEALDSGAPHAAVADAATVCSYHPNIAGAALRQIAQRAADPELSPLVWWRCQTALLQGAARSEGAPAWRAALDLLSSADTGVARHRLVALTGSLSHTPIERVDELVGALEAAGMLGAAARCALTAAMQALGEGHADIDRWSRYLRLVGGRMQRIPKDDWRYSQLGDRTPSREAVAALLDGIRRTDGFASDHAVLLVLRYLGSRTGWRSPWRELLHSFRESSDPDVAELAWLVDTGRSGGDRT